MGVADALIRVCPDLNPDAADEVSDSEVLRYGDIDPSLPAMNWVARQANQLANSSGARLVLARS